MAIKAKKAPMVAAGEDKKKKSPKKRPLEENPAAAKKPKVEAKVAKKIKSSDNENFPVSPKGIKKVSADTKAKKVKKEKSTASPPNKKEPLKKKIAAKQKEAKETKGIKVSKGEADSEEKGEKAEKTEEEKKEIRQKQKKLREERQKKSKTDDVYQMGVEAKRLWEKVRREDCEPKEKEELIAKLYASVKGQLKKVVFAHDTVRVMECLVSLGSAQMRDEMFKEAKEDLVGMCKSKYGHFFVAKLMKYGTKEQRAAIFKHFEGKVSELMKHKIANEVVENFYNEYANAAQRNRMLQEFCGPEFRRFKEQDVRTVAELIARHPEKERDIVRHLGGNVSTLVTKGCYNHSLVHTVIYNYLQVCKPKERSETIEQLRDVCLHVLHSHDGARLSMICFWHGSTKDRKAIIKTFKTFVKKICTEEHGYLVMLSLFDSVDDTKLVGKAILGELAENVEEIIKSEQGRKVIMHLCSPRDTTYFYPDVVALLRSGDGNEHSKKDAAVRAAELREVISPALCKYLLERMQGMLFDNPATIFMTCVINHASQTSARPLLALLAELAARPFVKGDDEPNLVETTATHIMLKKVIAHDKVRGKIEDSFSGMLLEALDEDGVEAWVRCNRGAFLFLCMIETEVDGVKERVKEKLKGFAKSLQAQKTPGAELLKKKLN